MTQRFQLCTVTDMRARLLYFALAGCALTPIAAAQQAVIVERNVNLRRDPSSNQAAIRLIVPPEELELRDTAKVNNYYHVVRAESHDTGWVWASNVRMEPASGPTGAAA